jgi:hypothetical protein
MNKQYACILGLLLFSLNIYAAKNWELIKEDEGIRIFSKSDNNSEFIEIKGVSETRGSLKPFVALMRDVNNFKNWMHAIKRSSVIERINENHFSYYLHSDIPWPGRDRDVVLNLRISRNPNNKVIYTETKNIPGVIPKKEGIRRIPSVKSSWQFIPLESNRIRIIFKTRIKPGVQLPDWLADMIYNQGPYHTIKNMKEMVNRQKYQSANINLNKI